MVLKECLICKNLYPEEAFAVVDDRQLKRCWAGHVRLARIRWERKKGYRPPAQYDKCFYRSYSRKLLPAVEDPIPDQDGYLMVACAHCGAHFYPTLQAVRGRITAISSDKYNGENRLYCSDQCKKSCSIFNQKSFPKGFAKERFPRELQGQLRVLVLERDNYACHICGDTEDLICHRYTGVRHNPIESADVDNCITVCRQCHKHIHHLPGCKPTDLQC